jgi:2-polyprenyl-3-methyl-5-hydroxy-6-metoxy-1,4-benzoquinol methylase
MLVSEVFWSMNNVQNEPATSYYDEAVKEFGLSELHRYLLAQVAPGSTVLELGPASGYMTKVLAAKGCRVDAIEINPRDAAKAAPYCRKLIVGSIEEAASFAELSGPYQVALMADVLEHLRAPEKTLSAVRQRLAPNGAALVSLPNIAYWKMRLDLLRGRFEYTDTGLLDRTHLRFFTLKTAKEMFAQAGFRMTQLVVPPPTIPRLGRLKERVKRNWPSLFSLSLIYHLQVDGARS